MGTDNLYHIRKAKKAKLHQRDKARRDKYERVLIACEGVKTEPNYFTELRNANGLNPRNIVISDKKKGLDPLSLVLYAIEEYKKDKDFEHVYCVFDKDKHYTYGAALDKIKNFRMRKGDTLHPITSVPCFELWLLLHFKYTTKQFCAPCNDSNCELLISDLKQYLPDYEKGTNNIFIEGKNLDTAIDNAKKLETFHRTSGTDNPSTSVYMLVEHLKRLKR